MNAKNTTRPISTDLPVPVQSAIDQHRIVVVASPITDLGLITRWLSQHGQDCCQVVLSMRSPASRADYEQLCQATRWRSLPQIFIDGEFIGGTEQFFDALNRESTAESAATDCNPWAYWLGYGGLIPFLALAPLSLFASQSVTGWATEALMAYGAIILSFVGALHWTRGLEAGDTKSAARMLTVSVLPALFGWVALLLPVHIGLGVLTAGFGLVYVYDRQAWRRWPAFLSLRAQLTTGAMGSLLMVWLGSAA